MIVALAAVLCAAAAAPPVDRFILLTETDDATRTGPTIEDGVRNAMRFRLGLRFLSPEEAFVEGGSDAETSLSSCAASAQCLAARLRGVRAEYALLLVVRRVAGEELLALRVVRAGTGEIARQAVLKAPARDPIAAATSSIARDAFDALGYQKGGELIVGAHPENAELAVDGVAATPGRAILLPPGAHQVSAKLAGFADGTANATVEATKTTHVDLLLAPRPESLAEQWWFWAGVGLAATAAGVAIGVLASGRRDHCLCAGADPAQCGSCP